jgi:hypothetical protein
MRRSSVLLLALGMFALGGGLVGQDKKEPAKAGQLPQGWGKANLGLTEEQKRKVLEADAKYDGEIDALTKKIGDLKKKKLEEQVAVLTDEQKKKLEDYFKSKAGTSKDKDK